jgi:hypothetical protein
MKYEVSIREVQEVDVSFSGDASTTVAELGEYVWDVTIDIPHEALSLLRWWLATDVADLEQTLPKMFEYGGDAKTRPGSADLRVIGEGLMELLGWPVNETTEAVAQELGCWFYLLGKSGRLISNYQQAQPGKADTWFDIGIYAKMARRIQETGNWP